MEKYGNKSPLMQFVHKNTGYIIVGVFLVIAVPLYLIYDDSVAFYERWTCPMMDSFHRELATHDGMKYSQMSSEEKEKFNEIFESECN